MPCFDLAPAAPLAPACRSIFSRLACLALLMVSALLAGCASMSEPAESGSAPSVRRITPWDQASVSSVSSPALDASAASRWQHHTFPGKAANQFAYLQLDGRSALGVKSRGAASMLRKTVSVEPEQLGMLRFSWKVPALIPDADMGQRDKSDSPVRLVLAFEGDRSRLSPRDHMLSELARALTGEEMPYATLMYVWCNQREPGSVQLNSRTDRIRKLVLESGPTRLNRWIDYERDVRADFIRAFGEPPGRLIAIGIMTDTDNTRSSAQAWYGPVMLSRADPPKVP